MQVHNIVTHLNNKETITMKKAIVIFASMLFIWSSHDLKAQFLTEGYFDLGNNNLSSGLYLQFSNTGKYEKKYWGGEAGYQLGLVQPQNVFFNSWYVNSYGKIPIGKINLVLGGEYLWTAFSPELREINWIVFARTTLKHWQFGLGNNSRIYRFSASAADDDQTVNPESKIKEGWNLMYNIQFVLKPYENNWNFMAAVTNYDLFVIQQETNPMLNIRFEYKLSEPLRLYSELWSRSSGFLNDQVNYFATYIRIGIQWKIERKR
jgi:hypothetical protein